MGPATAKGSLAGGKGESLGSGDAGWDLLQHSYPAPFLTHNPGKPGLAGYPVWANPRGSWQEGRCHVHRLATLCTCTGAQQAGGSFLTTPVYTQCPYPPWARAGLEAEHKASQKTHSSDP